MKYIVAGTAGHIDHGKTALVRALTGIETDRLVEEKRRGISIDIGFAHLQLTPDLRVAFVDVPGHERFIKNMLAGVTGIDLLLFIIAADSSVQPQTREHFDIARLLGIEHGIVVITKADLADDDLLSLVRLEVGELTQGSFLEHAPVVVVDSISGRGIDELKTLMAECARQIAARNATGLFRFSIDRAFAMRGFGAVVTGTVASGTVKNEEELELHPDRRKLRVRGLQVHGKEASRATAGERAAINLAQIEHTSLARGMSLTTPGAFLETQSINVSLELLPGVKPLRHRAPVHFHAGTAEIEAELRRLTGTARFEGGNRYVARLVLRAPALLAPGDRFIIRMFSPVVTIGGGTVLDVAPPRQDSEERARKLESAGSVERLQLWIAESRTGVETKALAARAGMEERRVREALPVYAGSYYLSAGREAEIRKDWLTQLESFHKQKPLLAGMPKEQLRGELDSTLFEAILQKEKRMVAAGDVVRLMSHKVVLAADEQEALSKIESAFARAGLTVPSVPEVLAGSGVEVARARSLLQILLRERKLVRISEELVFHPAALAELRSLVRAHKGEKFVVGQFKDWTGISRKYAIPLLELLDRERITRREGDSRLVL